MPVDTHGMSIRLLGLWESEIAGHVRRFCSDAHTACDVGANTGWYTMYFASRPNIRSVFAIEPDSSLLVRARENLQRNGEQFLARAVFVAQFCGDHDDERTVSLDTLLQDAEDPILLKIDVDGAELDVLRGATRILDDRRCVLVIETHSPELEEQCQTYLQSKGYDTRIIKNGWYRIIVPEHRPIPHNRWLVAKRPR
jgi:hypothetical protein